MAGRVLLPFKAAIAYRLSAEAGKGGKRQGQDIGGLGSTSGGAVRGRLHEIGTLLHPKKLKKEENRRVEQMNESSSFRIYAARVIVNDASGLRV